MTLDLNEKLKDFHGDLYHDGAWNSKKNTCCRLCKTTNPVGKLSHWASGLCRSCYRRLSATHRLYNDKWNEDNTKLPTAEVKKDPVKKNYKYTNPDEIKFSDSDIETLLERYDYKCAYCKQSLQDFDHKKVNAFQVEYKHNGTEFELIPSCRGCNCSKKNLTEPDKLKRWAYSRGLKYPFEFKPPVK